MKREDIFVTFGIVFLFALIIFYNLNIEFSAKAVQNLGGIYINSEPSGAKIYLNSYSLGKEDYVGETPKNLKKLSLDRSYDVRLEKEGYYDYKGILLLKEPGETLDINAVLIEKGYGNLFLSSNIESEFYVDGIIKGQTPLTLKLLPGNYKIKFLKDGYKAYEVIQAVVEGKTTNVNADLTPENNGEILISTTPDGARIFVDKEFRGETPKLISVAKGYHDIRLEKENYKKYEKGVYVEEEKELNVNLMNVKNAGTLFVDTIPDKAQVYLDNEYLGETPLRLEDVKIGDHRIKLVKQGFNNYIVSKHISAGRTTAIEATLEAEK